MGFILLLGLAWIAARAWDNGTPARQARRQSARQRVPSAHHRRAATQANIGWWMGEAGRGFPVTREGFRAGWDNHRHALADRQRQRTARQADQAIERQGWRAETASHLRRLEIAAERYRSGPQMTDQLRAAMRYRIRQLAGEQPLPEADPGTHLPDGTTPGQPPPRHGSPPETQDYEPYVPSEPSTTNGNQQNGDKPMADGGTGDATFTYVNETCD